MKLCWMKSNDNVTDCKDTGAEAEAEDSWLGGKERDEFLVDPGLKTVNDPSMACFYQPYRQALLSLSL